MNIITSLPIAVLLIAPHIGPTCAHPTLEQREANIGAPYKAIMRVPHGCDGAATTRVRVQIPEGIIGVKLQPKPGWAIETKRRPYANSYPYYHGATLTEGVREISWSGRLLDEHFDEFVCSGFVAASLKAGEMVHFPTVQECEKGSSAWTEIAAAGQSPHDVKLPAPAIRLVQAQGHGQHGRHAAQPAPETRTYKAGDLVIETPWTRATPGKSKVGAGFMKIANTGKEPDRLIGGSAEVAKDFEVHEMTMSGDVMKMRRLAKGLEIKPGESVELKPSSYHIMFMGLHRPLKQDETIKGTLVFERAGTVAVEYSVRPLGAQPAGQSGGHKHH
jgi:periplasmic copper chaperone A